MATTKTLTPTNQAITISAFTEKPDNRVNATNDDKLADAVNALNSNKMNSTIGSSLQSVDILAQAPGAYRYNGNCSNIPSAEAGFMQIVERDSTTKVATAISNSGRTFSNAMIGGTWIGWKELAQNSNFTSFLGNDTTSDCNSETATGFKKAINSTANTPYAGHFVVFTFNYNQNEMIQFAMSTNANAIYFRYYNSSWSSWKMLGWNS